MASQKPTYTPQRKIIFSRVAMVVAAFLLLYAVVPQLTFFDGAQVALRSLHWAWLAAGTTAFAGTYIAAALMYVCLGQRRIPLGKTVLIQIVAAFANRLLPVGSGAISVNYGYLLRHKYDGPEAAGIIATNNVLGFVGHAGIITAALLLNPTVLHLLRWPTLGWGAGALVVLAAIAGGVIWCWRRRTVRFLRGMLRDIAQYRRRPGRLAAALGISISLTLLYVLTFYCCMRTAGVQLGGVTTLIVYTLGVVIGTVTPLPGGIGGAEAALIGGLTSFGVAPANALVAVLSYRLITFWLALVIGAAAFIVTIRRHSITP